MNSFKFDHSSESVSSNQRNLVTCYELNHDNIIPHPHPPSDPTPSSGSGSGSGSGSDGDSPNNCEKGDKSSAVFKYISDMLMEEDLESKPCMLQDCLALQAAEKSFYDVLGQKYSPSPNFLSPCFDQSVESSVDSNNSYTTANNLDSQLISDQVEIESSHAQTSLFDPPENTLLVPGLWQFDGGIVEVSKVLPHEVAYAEKDLRYYSSNGSRGKKNHQREDGDYLEEGRSNKHSATSLIESQQLDLFDEVFGKSENDDSVSCPIFEAARKRASEKLQQNGQLKGSNGRTTSAKKRSGSKGDVVDLWTRLTQCAQAVSSSNQTTANELLRQIRQHSSPFGDGTQRMAHYFANALEARLAGTGTSLYAPIVSSKISAADFLKAYLVFVSACPFRRMTNSFTNRTIVKLAEKATRIHIIDFGILYGFQWPCFIQRLSKRPGGPPKIRITGIDFPQPGFKPAERVEETGRRLKTYCEKFNVPFEYNAIAQRWDTIRLENLKIDREEMTVVTCLYRLRNLPDDTVVLNSPRDVVLRLVKRINPDLFVHGVLNGTFNAPTFVTRFREALFYFSAMFDIIEANVPREDEDRLLFERELLGTEAMNVIACEGLERIERPETYKQWQARNLRIGFRPLPLDRGILKKVKKIVKSEYHDDFDISEDGHWMLQGWKGRIIHALSSWIPVQDKD